MNYRQQITALKHETRALKLQLKELERQLSLLKNGIDSSLLSNSDDTLLESSAVDSVEDVLETSETEEPVLEEVPEPEQKPKRKRTSKKNLETENVAIDDISNTSNH